MPDVIVRMEDEAQSGGLMAAEAPVTATSCKGENTDTVLHGPTSAKTPLPLLKGTVEPKDKTTCTYRCWGLVL